MAFLVLAAARKDTLTVDKDVPEVEGPPIAIKTLTDELG